MASGDEEMALLSLAPWFCQKHASSEGVHEM
jgi:hypothetical protein